MHTRSHIQKHTREETGCGYTVFIIWATMHQVLTPREVENYTQPYHTVSAGHAKHEQ